MKLVSDEDAKLILEFIEQKKAIIEALGFKITKVLSQARDLRTIKKARINLAKLK